MATKTAAKKTETVKKTTTITEPEKTSAVKETAEKASVDDKVTTKKKAPEQARVEKKKAVEKKTVEKKATKPAAKKEIKVKAVVEFAGKQVDEKDIFANVKKAWTKSGKKVGDIKTVELYIKPEDAAVYYVINKTEKGSVAF